MLDLGNGLGAQDPVIAQLLRPDCLVAVNVSLSRAGRPALTVAGAAPAYADAVRLPVASGRVDTLITVEAALHFASRARFFAEATQVLRTARGRSGQRATLRISLCWSGGPRSCSAGESKLVSCRTTG